MNDFIFVNNWFQRKYMQNSSSRFWTFQIALNIFLQKEGKLILETGCQRLKNDWGGGCSTLLFGDFCSYFNKKLITVDLSPDNIDLAKKETSAYSTVIEYNVSDSLTFLRSYKGEAIDLLYLDSFDACLEDESLTKKAQEHQLQEMQLALPLLAPEAVVLLDDNNLPFGGKTVLTKVFLLSQGFRLIMDYQQSLFYKVGG